MSQLGKLQLGQAQRGERVQGERTELDRTAQRSPLCRRASLRMLLAVCAARIVRRSWHGNSHAQIVHLCWCVDCAQLSF